MSPSEKIDQMVVDLADWRGRLIAHIRQLITKADPAITEEWKWGTAVWSHDGLVCAVASFKDHVKVNFFKGAALKDSDSLFNSGLEAKATRAIDIYEHNQLDDDAFKRLITAAIAYNS
jgi:hypothetical protein